MEVAARKALIWTSAQGNSICRIRLRVDVAAARAFGGDGAMSAIGDGACAGNVLQILSQRSECRRRAPAHVQTERRQLVRLVRQEFQPS